MSAFGASDRDPLVTDDASTRAVGMRERTQRDGRSDGWEARPPISGQRNEDRHDSNKAVQRAHPAREIGAGPIDRQQHEYSQDGYSQTTGM